MLTVSADDLEQTFGYKAPRGYAPRFNIAPSQTLMTLTGDPSTPFGEVTWGFVPHSSAPPSASRRFINARAESVYRTPAFKSAFESRRCLVVVDGYYEWQQQDGSRRPHRVCLAGREPFTIAAIWERGGPGESASAAGCAILTTAAAPSIATIHERMPVIIGPEARERWLSGESTKAELVQHLVSYEGGDLEAYEVSPLVNSPANDSPACVEPFDGAAYPPQAATSSRSRRRKVSSEVLDLFSLPDLES